MHAHVEELIRMLCFGNASSAILVGHIRFSAVKQRKHLFLRLNWLMAQFWNAARFLPQRVF
jgi:hypothetical protein